MLTFSPNRGPSALRVVTRSADAQAGGPDLADPAPQPEPLPIGFAEPDHPCHHCGSPTVAWDRICLHCRGRDPRFRHHP